ncbi:MAG: fibronectin type III domain-containing protein [Bacteroidota bacterium]
MKKLLILVCLAVSFSAFAQKPTYKYISGTNPELENLENAVFDLTEPGPRQGAITFTDSIGNLWLFGGTGSDLNFVDGYYSDFWQYDRDLQIWTWYEGKITVDRPLPMLNNSLTFNVDNADRVIIDPDVSDFDEDLTIELWFKTTEEFFSPLIALTPDNPTERTSGWALTYDFGRLEFVYGNGVDIFLLVQAEDLDLSDGEWHHVAVTTRGPQGRFSTGISKLFVDGEKVGELNSNPPVYNQETHSVMIGYTTRNSFQEYFRGSIDEVRIWSNTRTESEISSFYNIELAGNEDFLDAYFDFNQGVAGSPDNREVELLNKVEGAPNGTLDFSYRNASFLGELAATRFWRTDLGDNRIRLNAKGTLDALSDTTNLAFSFEYEDGVPGGKNFDKSQASDGSVNDELAGLVNFNLSGDSSNYLEDRLPLLPDTYFFNAGALENVFEDVNKDGFLDMVSAGGFNLAYLENNQDGTFGNGVSFEVGGEARSLTALDWNDDDNIDFAVSAFDYTQNAPSKIRMLYSDGTGAILSTTDIDIGANGQPLGMNTADFNGDNFPDLIVSLVGFNVVRIYFGDGTGSFDNFIDVPVEGLNASGSPEPEVTDFNNDGLVDFGVPNIMNNQRQYQVYLNDGTGVYDNPVITPFVTDMNNMSTVDYNQDGIPDIIFESRDFQNNAFNAITWRGVGDGTFDELVTTEIGRTINSFNSGELNENGLLELFIAYDFSNEGPSFSYAQLNLDGTIDLFNRFSTINNVYQVGVADLDKNGITDVVAFAFAEANVFLRDQTDMLRTMSINTLNFDGVDDFIEFDDFRPFDQSFVFETWIKTTDNGTIFSFTPEMLDHEWESSLGSFSFAIRDGQPGLIIEGTDDRFARSQRPLIDGEWHHLALRVSNYDELEFVTIFLDNISIFGEEFEFDDFLQTGNSSYTSKIGYATDDFADVLGVTRQLPGSNWAEGFDFFAGEDGRAYAVSWQDSAGNLMVFGGEGEAGLYNTLKKYDLNLKQWVIVDGEDVPDGAAFYGELNVPDDSNIPSVRRFSRGVQDNDGNIWLFGGLQSEDNLNNELLNDLWFYDAKNNIWTWKGGSNEPNALASYGTMGVGSTANIPGARESHQMWIDDQNTIWLMGGYGLDAVAEEGYLNDLWKYEIATGEWTWVAGGDQNDLAGVYGQLGVSSPENYPGSRAGSLTWKDQNGLFWFFGGRGYDKFGERLGYLNDHWSFNPQTGEWIWYGGSNFANSTGVYNQKGISSTEFIPGARIQGTTWVDDDDNLWMFGGFLNSSTGTGLYSDFWLYEKESGEWTWFNGKNSTGTQEDVGVYGQIGNGSKPHPGARHGALTWTDSNDDFWMMGGSFFSSGSFGGFFNDLWKFDVANEAWEYRGGSTSLTINEGDYGALGVSNSNNEPKSRWHGASWVDKRDRLWFFGGIHRNTVTNSVAWINDLWVYDPASDVFTWMGGQPDIGGSGKYGTKGVPSAANIPGARSSSADWVDDEGNFWLFGGYENFEYNNDLWKFNPETLEWMWVSGNSFQNTPGTYGQRGVASPENVIGSRRYADAWVGKDGKIWIFGGQAIDGKARLGLMNDLWQYDPDTNLWTWMHGSDSVGTIGSYGTKGVADPANVPPPRYGHATWVDDAGNLWMMGGLGEIVNDDDVLIRDQLNDLWKYDIRENVWIWVGGSNKIVQEPTMGMQGVFSESNVIHGRERIVPFESRGKSLWLFGGRQDNITSLGDFWEIKFTPGSTTVEVQDDNVGQHAFKMEYEEPWANEYHIQVADNEDFDDLIFDQQLTDKEAVVTGLEAGTFYYYRVNAINEIGQSMFGDEFGRVLTLPAAPEFLEADMLLDSVTPFSATIRWNDNAGVVENYLIEVSRDPIFRDTLQLHEGFRSKMLPGSVDSVEITSLQPGTVYYARLRAGNNTGISEYSEIVSFLTAPKRPETVTLNRNNIRANGFAVVWVPVEEILDDYKILVSTDPNFENPDSVLADYNFASIGKEFNSTVIDSLKAGRQYFMRLYAGNSSGLSLPSETVSVLTLPAPPVFPLEPENAFVDSVSQNTVRITWNAPSEIFDGYLMEVSEESTVTIPELRLNGYGRFNPKPIDKSENLETISGLESGETYHARIRSFNESGQSVNSNIITFLTVPSAPTNLQVENISQEGARLTWNAVKGADNYLFEFSDSPDFPEGTVEELNGESQNLTSLQPGVKYYVRVQSQNDAGSSGAFDDYDSLSFVTIPGTPGEISFSDFGQSSVTASWNPVSGATGYQVDVSDNGFQTFITGYNNQLFAQSEVQINGLTPGVGYDIRVRSVIGENKVSPNRTNSNVQFFTVPATPIARDASKVSANGFSVNWDPSVGADAYELTVFSNEDSGFQIIDTVTVVASYNVSGVMTGTEYQYFVRGLNQSGASAESATISVVAQNSSQTLSIASLEYDADYSATAANTEIPLVIRTTGGFADPTVTLRYRGVTESVWSDYIEIPESGSDNVYEFTFAENLLDDIGLLFDVVASDGFVSDTLANNTINRVFSESQSEPLPDLVFGGWQMISIPFVLDDDLVTSIFNELVSLEYKKRWRLMHYVNDEYQDAITGFTRMELGKGYWFFSKNEVTINVGAGKTNTEVPTKIPIATGWNQIGNPFNGVMEWRTILRNNGESAFIDDLFVYSSAGNEFSETTTLNPFEGAFVWSDRDTELDLFPGSMPPNGRAEVANRPGESLDEGDNWMLPLTISINGQSKQLAGFGMHENANELKDTYDKMLLPRFGDYLEMYTTHDAYSYPYFRTDMVPVRDEYVWHFDLESNHQTGKATLSWDSQLLADREVWLVDESTGQVIEMDARNQYQFTFSGSRQLSVQYSLDPNYQPIPSRLILGDAYPNPTLESTNIPVLLPDSNERYGLELSIYDLQGKKVATVAKGEFEPGLHLFKWEKDAYSTSAGGVYFYRLSFTDSELGVLQKKLIIKQ